MNSSPIEDRSLLGPTEKSRLLKRPQRLEKVNLSSLVSSLLADVKRRGDLSLKDLTLKYDGFSLSSLKVSPEIKAQALEGLDNELRAA